MGIEEIKGFRTSDGKLHFDYAEAVDWEFKLQKKGLLDGFLINGIGAEYTERGKSSATRIIGEFCDWLSEDEIELPWAKEQHTKPLEENEVSDNVGIQIQAY